MKNDFIHPGGRTGVCYAASWRTWIRNKFGFPGSVPDELRHIFEVMYLDSGRRLLTVWAAFRNILPADPQNTTAPCLKMENSPGQHCLWLFESAPKELDAQVKNSEYSRQKLRNSCISVHPYLSLSVVLIQTQVITYSNSCSLWKGTCPFHMEPELKSAYKMSRGHPFSLLPN